LRHIFLYQYTKIHDHNNIANIPIVLSSYGKQ